MGIVATEKACKNEKITSLSRLILENLKEASDTRHVISINP